MVVEVEVCASAGEAERQRRRRRAARAKAKRRRIWESMVLEPFFSLSSSSAWRSSVKECF